MDQQRVTKVRKKTVGGFSQPVPIGAKAENVTLSNGTVLQDAIDELQHGKAGHEVMTYAQWNSLSKDEKDNGTVYFITDYTQQRLNQAENVIFDNTEAQIGNEPQNITNVQNAIEELKKANAPKIYDDLDSIDNTKALSARQGKILNDSKQDKLTWDVNTNQVTVSEATVTGNEQDQYQQVGNESFTLQANSTYLICVYVQVREQTSPYDSNLTFSLGTPITNDLAKKVTVKTATDTAYMWRYTRFSFIIHTDGETSYCGWLAKNNSNDRNKTVEARVTWQAQYIKLC